MFAIRASTSEKTLGLVHAVTSAIKNVEGNIIGAELRVIEDYGFVTAVVWVDDVLDDQEVARSPATSISTGVDLVRSHSVSSVGVVTVAEVSDDAMRSMTTLTQ